MSNHRTIVPINTGRVQIGLTYIPKPTARQAQWISHYVKRPLWLRVLRYFWSWA